MKLRTFLALFCAIIFMILSCSRDNADNGRGSVVKHYPPDKPQGLFAVANNSSEITVSWQQDASADTADYYHLFKSTDSLGEYSVVSSYYYYYDYYEKEIYDNEKTVANLLSSTKYYFKLVAVNEYGASDTSDIVSEKTFIDAPKNLKTTFLPVNELILEWDEVVDNQNRFARGNGGSANGNASSVKYKIYSSENPTEEYSFVNETNETRMKFSNLDNTKTYYYKVSAVDSDDREGAKSDYISVSVLGDLPSVPQGLFANLTIDNFDNGKISVNLTWNSVNDADEYKVYRSTQPQISYDYYAPTKNNSMTINELKTGTKYYFKVSAVNSNGESSKSQEVSVQTPQPTAPSTPTGLSAQGIASDTILIKWNSVSTATGYYVYYASNQNGTYTKAGPYSGNSLRLYGMTAGSTRYFKVSAINNYGESQLSSPVSATTKM